MAQAEEQVVPDTDADGATNSELNFEIPDNYGDFDNDRDALHILPLPTLPLQTPALRTARMIKNVGLKSVIEVFRDEASGSGQFNIDDLPNEFSWPEGLEHPDYLLLRKVASLPSFDIYSLRIQLRELEIEVENYEMLRLSKKMNGLLVKHMSHFTYPLIVEIYGDDREFSAENFEDMLKLFKEPDVMKALERLKIMAQKLGISPEEVPGFLEDYGDVFLSLGYFRRCFDSVTPIVESFKLSLEDLRTCYQIKNDLALMNTFNDIEATLDRLIGNIHKRFDVFDRSSENMWSEISARRFRQVEDLVRGSHVTIGGMICALSVKMDAWARAFPDNLTGGGPQRRAEFIHSELRQGIDLMRNFERNAPKVFEIR